MNADENAGNLSELERAALKERVAELKKESKRGDKSAAAERDVLEKIAAMEPADRAIATRIHDLVREHSPGLNPKLWYGQPAYARSGKVVCFFRSGADDKERYSTFGFTPEAQLDDGGLWPTSFAVAELTAKAEKAITELLERAVD